MDVSGRRWTEKSPAVEGPEPAGPRRADSPRADGNADLDHLIDLSVDTYDPIVITENGQDVGVVNKARLLRGIQGGKDA